MSRERTLVCPHCRAHLSELMPVIDNEFIFACGTRYGVNGGLGAIKQSPGCKEEAKANAQYSYSVKPRDVF